MQWDARPVRDEGGSAGVSFDNSDNVLYRRLRIRLQCQDLLHRLRYGRQFGDGFQAGARLCRRVAVGKKTTPGTVFGGEAGDGLENLNFQRNCELFPACLGEQLGKVIASNVD